MTAGAELGRLVAAMPSAHGVLHQRPIRSPVPSSRTSSPFCWQVVSALWRGDACHTEGMPRSEFLRKLSSSGRLTDFIQYKLPSA